ncbi:MAG: SH3-like domain-containing protein [Xanthobacteraceae bacterium]
MEARFRAGDTVLVLDLVKTGHLRTPFYIRGKVGTIVELCGCYLNPEDLAVGNTAGPVVALYRVGFPQTRLWAQYSGSSLDTLYIEIYDHWLAGAPAEAGVDDHADPRAEAGSIS